MKESTFDELQIRLQQKYADQDFSGAYDLATRYCEFYPEERHHLYYWRSTMAARMGDFAKAISLLKEMLDSGFWYGEVLLQKSPSYELLQGTPEFQELVALNRNIHELEHEQRLPLLTIRAEGNCLDEEDACPMLMGLHGNASNAQSSINFWRAAATEGWLVAVPQSSQAMWKGAFI